MKTVFESVIQRGNFDLSGLLKRINYYHIQGGLTDSEMEELTAKARAAANAAAGMDMTQKLLDLDARVAALEKRFAQGGDNGEIPEYTPGKWYYQGDKVLYGGSTYTCIAPLGVVCTWSPDEHPAYWEKA